MPLTTLKVYVITKLLSIVAGAALFGGVSGYLGSTVDHYNHTHFGTVYSEWRGEWLGVPGLPGALLAEWQKGYDWRADEEWANRHSVATWNALFWSFAALILSAPFVRRSARGPHAPNEPANEQPPR